MPASSRDSHREVCSRIHLLVRRGWACRGWTRAGRIRACRRVPPARSIGTEASDAGKVAAASDGARDATGAVRRAAGRRWARQHAASTGERALAGRAGHGEGDRDRWARSAPSHLGTPSPKERAVTPGRYRSAVVVDVVSASPWLDSEAACQDCSPSGTWTTTRAARQGCGVHSGRSGVRPGVAPLSCHDPSSDLRGPTWCDRSVSHR